MPCITLEPNNYQSVLESLQDESWIVACLCAEWCGTCRGYRKGFDELADRHPGKHFIWIDIEDQADLLGDLDVENFPTMLIQRGDIVTYFAPVLPDHRQGDRMLLAQMEQSIEEQKKQALSTKERAGWQQSCNLRKMLRDFLGGAKE
jgi:thiol-disulfide isomerase/thioredoxin